MSAREPRPVLEVAAAGLAAVQDLGRPGFASLGVAANGAADQRSARLANVLVGNRQGAPLIEVVGSRLALRAREALIVAVTGAVGAVRASSGERPSHDPFLLSAGETLEVEPGEAGLRWYLAVRGELQADRVLGSVAVDTFLGVGRSLRPGDVIEARGCFRDLDHPFSRIPLFRLGARRPRLAEVQVVDVTLGPDAPEFPDLDVLFERSYTVSPATDHVGARLVGEAPMRAVEAEILSRGVPIGAIEVPPGGGLIALLRGRFVTAGYPIPAVATAAGLAVVGQLRPGESVRFRLVDAAAALRQVREEAGELRELAARADRAFAAAGLPREPVSVG